MASRRNWAAVFGSMSRSPWSSTASSAASPSVTSPSMRASICAGADVPATKAVSRSTASGSRELPIPASSSTSLSGSTEQRCPRQGEQDRLLALDEIAAGGLARSDRIAEHAEQIVPQLEPDADGRSVPAQRIDERRRSSAEGGAQMQRSLDRVGRRLVPVDHQGVGGRQPGVGGFVDRDPQVQQLATEHLGTHRPPRRSGSRRMPESVEPVVEQVVRPGQGKISEQQRGGRPEVGRVAGPTVAGMGLLHRAVHAGLPAADVRVVDDVVVDQGAGLDEFQGRRRLGHTFREHAVRSLRTAAGRGQPAPAQELWPQSFATRRDITDQPIDVVREPGIDGEYLGTPRLEVGGEHRFHGGQQVCGFNGLHGASLPDR